MSWLMAYRAEGVRAELLLAMEISIQTSGFAVVFGGHLMQFESLGAASACRCPSLKAAQLGPIIHHGGEGVRL